MRGQERMHSAAEARALKMLRALASPARFRVVEILAERKDCTSPQLMDELGLAQSSLHDHLTALREAGIIQTSGDGPNRYYCLDPAGAGISRARILVGSGSAPAPGPGWRRRRRRRAR